MNLCYFSRTKKRHQNHGCYVKKGNLRSSPILESLLASQLDGEEFLIRKAYIISNILLVGVMEHAERIVLVFSVELVVKNIVGM